MLPVTIQSLVLDLGHIPSPQKWQTITLKAIELSLPLDEGCLEKPSLECVALTG